LQGLDESSTDVLVDRRPIWPIAGNVFRGADSARSVGAS